MNNAKEILKDAKVLLKAATDTQKKSTEMLDRVLRGASKKQRKELAPIMKLKADLTKAQANQDTSKISEILNELIEINGAGVNNTK